MFYCIFINKIFCELKICFFEKVKISFFSEHWQTAYPTLILTFFLDYLFYLRKFEKKSGKKEKVKSNQKMNKNKKKLVQKVSKYLAYVVKYYTFT